MDRAYITELVASTVALVNRIADRIWRSSTPPTGPLDHVAWVKPDALQNEFLVNIGTFETPEWVRMAPMTNISANDVIYPTHEILYGKRVWAIRWNLGTLPNTTTKSLTIPSGITNIWGPPQERNIDYANTYIYTAAGDIRPLPYVSFYQKGAGGSTDSVIVELEGNIIRLRTESNRTSEFVILTLKFTRS